jgi:hypothetical protein
MSKKLMLLAAGALAALAFAALPTVASASEMIFHCEGAATCTGTIAGGASTLSNDKGETISCTATSGSVSGTSTTSTMTTKIIFTGCVETISGFKFGCTNTTTGGKIETNSMTGHLITRVLNDKLTVGSLLTGANVTFTCAAFLKRTVTGNIIGTFTEQEKVCDETADTSHKLDFAITSHGIQADKVYTGVEYDLTGRDHGKTEAESPYTTSAQTGEGTITYSNPVRITC